MAEGSIFARFKDEEQLLEVDMNEVEILEPDDEETAIGTQNLRGCSTVIVQGQAIILAHVSPYPTEEVEDEDDARAGLRHFASKLAEVRELYNQHSNHFQGASLAWGIFARFEGEVALQHHLDLAGRFFSAMGLPTQPAFYDVHLPRRTDPPPGEGTVVAFRATASAEARIFVEDSLQHRRPSQPTSIRQQPSTSSRTTTTSTASTASTAARWVYANGQYICYEGSNPVRTQTNPPQNIPIWNGAVYIVWNGKEWMRV